MSFRFLASLLCFGTFPIAQFVHAEAGLPYLGQRPTPCKVQGIDSTFKARDAGYLADEACTTIYVLPPLLGSLKISPPAYLSTEYCPIVEETSTEMAQVRTEMENETDFAAKIKIVKQLNEMKKAIDAIGKNEAFSVFSFTASIDWNTLTNAYQKANPQFNVLRMPIMTGLINADITDTDLQDTDGQSPLLNLKIYAPTFDQAAITDTSGTGSVVKKMLSGLNLQGTYIFGSAVGGQMSLRLLPTCGLFKDSGAIKTDALSFFAGTYTYFYPIQTSSSYSIKLGEQQFESAIFKVLNQQNGTISSSQLSDILKATPIIQIEKRDGVGDSTDSDELEKVYKGQLLQIVGNSILGVIADKITNSVSQAQFTTQEARTEHGCHGDWPFTHCEDHTYYISVQHINWGVVRANLQNLLGDQDPKVVKYRTLYLFGTSAFANVDQN